jgi:8-oxo-dGTP pyrophosphatase MutT (NUDIX family)
MKKFYVGIKAVVRDGDKGILLLHRDYKSGDYWDTPGGRIDGAEKFEDTLRRELNEELPGINNIQIGELAGAHRVQKDIEGDTSLVLLYFLVSAILPEPVAVSDEHESYMWVKNKNEIPEGLNPVIRKIFEDQLS